MLLGEWSVQSHAPSPPTVQSPRPAPTPMPPSSDVDDYCLNGSTWIWPRQLDRPPASALTRRRRRAVLHCGSNPQSPGYTRWWRGARSVLGRHRLRPVVGRGMQRAQVVLHHVHPGRLPPAQRSDGALPRRQRRLGRGECPLARPRPRAAGQPLCWHAAPVLLTPERFLRDIPVATSEGLCTYAWRNNADDLRTDFNWDLAQNVGRQVRAKMAR